MPPASNGRGVERFFLQEHAMDPLPVRRHAILLRIKPARSTWALLRACDEKRICQVVCFTEYSPPGAGPRAQTQIPATAGFEFKTNEFVSNQRKLELGSGAVPR